MVSRYDPAAVPTIRCLPDALWAECQPLLPPAKPPARRGGPPSPTARSWMVVGPAVMAGGAEFGSGSTYRRFHSGWDGTWARLWRDQLQRYDQEHGSGTGKCRSGRCPPLGGDATGPDPTNRGKLGTKRHVLSIGGGCPWAWWSAPPTGTT